MFAKLTKTEAGYDLPVVSVARARGFVDDKGIQHSADVFRFWSPSDLRGLGYLAFEQEAIPDDKISTGFEDVIEGDKVIRRHNLVDDPSYLDRQKATRLNALKAKRDSVCNAGLVIDGKIAIHAIGEVVQTDAASRSLITGALLRLERDEAVTSQFWRMLSDNMVEFSQAEFQAMALAVSALVDEAYQNYAVLEVQILAASDFTGLGDIDLEAGWPDHYNPPKEGA